MTGSGKTKLSLRLHSAEAHSALSTLTTRLVFRNKEVTRPPYWYPVLHLAFPGGRDAVLWERPLGPYSNPGASGGLPGGRGIFPEPGRKSRGQPGGEGGTCLRQREGHV